MELYTKPGCGLCDDVVHQMQQLSPKYPHQLQQIDITTDAALFARYRYTIPVVQIGDELLQAPITPSDLEAALATAVATL